jgi:outer membrane protein TolC
VLRCAIAHWRAATFVLVAAAAVAPGPLGGQGVSLSDAVTRALTQSEAITIARAGVTRARGQVIQGESNLYPQVSGNASYTRTFATQYSSLIHAPTTGPRNVPLCTIQFDSTVSPAARQAALAESQSCLGPTVGQEFATVGFGALNTYQLGLTVSQTIFNGQFFAAASAASVPRQAAEIELTAQRSQVIYDVAQAYYDASLADELATIADSTMAQDERTLAEARVGQRVGAQSEYDLLQSQVTRDNQRPVVLQSHNNRDIAYQRLAQLLKMPLDAPLHLTTTVDSAADLPGGVHLPALVDSTSMVAAGDTAAERRSSVREQALAVREYEALLSQNRAEYLPTLTLWSGYARVAYPTGGLPAWNSFLENWSLTLGASVPIFNGFRTHGDILVAQANVTEQRARLQQTRDAAALDAHSALAGLREATAGWSATTGSVDQAAHAFQIAEIRFRSGLSTLVELTASRLALQQSLANRAQAARNLQVARVRMALIRDLPLSPVNPVPLQVPAPTPSAPATQFNPMPSAGP